MIKNNTLRLLLTLTIFTANFIDARLTEYNFSDIQAPDNGSFKDDLIASKKRITEEMCDGHTHQKPTPESILNFITNIQAYINNILDTQTITQETVKIARLAVIDVAKARKMLRHTTPADIQTDIRHAIAKIDMEVINLEKYLRIQSQS